jgi:hypothetical protein
VKVGADKVRCTAEVGGCSRHFKGGAQLLSLSDKLGTMLSLMH